MKNLVLHDSDIKEGRLPSRPSLRNAAIGKPPLLGAPPCRSNWLEWIALPILLIPTLVVRNHVAPWIFMWLMAGAIFFGCKWLTFWRARKAVDLSAIRAIGYLFAWPGMEAEKFLTSRRQTFPRVAPVAFAIAKMLLGAFLLFVLARHAPEPLLAGWIGMSGMILILHFGLFHLAAIGWRVAGVEVDPIMNAPLRSTSLSEFWGRRWNGAFNRLAHDFVFRRLARRFGLVGATLAAFLVSGLVHELVISLPARAGYGLPTGYFLLQGSGILLQRSQPRVRGRLFTILFVALPAFFLFHPPFVRQVILPFMHAIRAV